MSSFHPTRRALSLVAVAAVWLLAGGTDAAACMCGRVSVCEALGQADAVFVGTVASQREVERDTNRGDDRTFKMKFQVSLFQVEESFSGLGGATEVEIETDLSSSCAFPLAHAVRYLVYAYKDKGEKSALLGTGMCTRTARVERAAADLEYLRGSASRAGAVVEGVVAYAGAPAGADGEPAGADTVGVTTVVAEGGGRRAEARVGAGGRFQFRNLPPGKYHVSVPLPDELTVLDPYHPDIAEEIGLKDQHEIEVPARGCVAKHLVVADNGRISGRLTDADGVPVAGIKIELRRPRESGPADDDDDVDDEADEDLNIRTDADGQYAFRGLPPGRYLIGVRLGRYLTEDEPAAAFRRTFYPGVLDEREAIAVSLGRGQNVTRRDFQVGPRLRERTISGIVLRRDGRPAAGARVRYQARTPDRERTSPVSIKADERGRFSFNGYEGTAFLVGARTDKCAGKNCAHAHEVEVGPTGTPRPLRLVLDQPDKSCERCRNHEDFEEGKP